MAHGIEDRIVELNGSWDQEGGMLWLARHSYGLLCFLHLLVYIWVFLLFDDVATLVFEMRRPFSGEWGIKL